MRVAALALAALAASGCIAARRYHVMTLSVPIAGLEGRDGEALREDLVQILDPLVSEVRQSGTIEDEFRASLRSDSDLELVMRREGSSMRVGVAERDEPLRDTTDAPAFAFSAVEEAVALLSRDLPSAVAPPAPAVVEPEAAPEPEPPRARRRRRRG